MEHPFRELLVKNDKCNIPIQHIAEIFSENPKHLSSKGFRGRVPFPLILSPINSGVGHSGVSAKNEQETIKGGAGGRGGGG